MLSYKNIKKINTLSFFLSFYLKNKILLPQVYHSFTKMKRKFQQSVCKKRNYILMSFCLNYK